MTSQHPPEKILFLSDLHRGAKISTMPQYEAQLLAKMREYDHIVFNGDIFELMFTSGSRHNDDEKQALPRFIVKKEIQKSKKWLSSLLEQANDKGHKIKVHFVLGNHENIRKFRKSLTRIEQKYPGQFEWDAESIRLGDALITHGDLQENNQCDRKHPQMAHRRIWRMKHANHIGNWHVGGWAERVVNMGDWIAHRVWHGDEYSAENFAPKIHARLKEWNNTDKFSYRHGKERHNLTMDWIKHVFLGHTHVKYHDHKHKDEETGQAIAYHNTGSLVRTMASSEEGIGILEAELDNGRIDNVRPVRLGLKATAMPAKNDSDRIPIIPIRPGFTSTGR